MPLTTVSLSSRSCAPSALPSSTITTTISSSAKLYKTETSSTRVSRKRHHRTHYTIHLTRRKTTGGPSCDICDLPKSVRFADKCCVAVYDVVSGDVLREFVDDVDFEGGKIVGLFYDSEWEE